MFSSLLLSVLLVLSAQAQATETTRTAMIPSFTVSELFALSQHNLHHRQAEFVSILQTTGLLSIQLQSTPTNPTTTRYTALDGLCACVSNNNKQFLSLDGTDTAVLDDFTTVRTTLATATVGTTPLALPLDDLEEQCGSDVAHAMEGLRDHAAEASRAFVRALDASLLPALVSAGSSSTSVMRDAHHGKRYPTISSLLSTANHLEHFHVYSKANEDDSSTRAAKASLDWHTDAGLFLAFVPAMNCNGGSSTQDSDKAFFFKDAEGHTTRAVFEDDSIVFMLGAGAEHWLTTGTANMKLKATQHAVQMKAGSERAWYGMMHLVPESAIIQTSPDRTFGDMKKNMVLTGQRHREYGHDDTPEVVSIGCGPSTVVDQHVVQHSDMLDVTPRRRMQHVTDATACNNSTNFFCWMRCLDVPQHKQAPSYVNEGYSLYCLDPGILASSGNKVSSAVEPCLGFVHNSNCMGVWQPTAPGVVGQEVEFDAIPVKDPPFCYGGTSMYMDGFTWIHDTTCVIYLFPSWVLTTQGKFVAAAIGTFIFGILLEYAISQRRKVVSKLGPGYRRLATSALFYALQLTMGYLLMLVVMIYSGPLFMCTILGIVGGHVLFNAKDAVFNDKKKTSHTGGMMVEETACCCSNNNNKEDLETITAGDEACCSSSGKAESDDNDGVPEGSTPCCQHTL